MKNCKTSKWLNIPAHSLKGSLWASTLLSMCPSSTATSPARLPPRIWGPAEPRKTRIRHTHSASFSLPLHPPPPKPKMWLKGLAFSWFQRDKRGRQSHTFIFRSALQTTSRSRQEWGMWGNRSAMCDVESTSHAGPAATGCICHTAADTRRCQTHVPKTKAARHRPPSALPPPFLFLSFSTCPTSSCFWKPTLLSRKRDAPGFKHHLKHKEKNPDWRRWLGRATGFKKQLCRLPWWSSG